MKKIIINLSCLLATVMVNAQAPTFQWVKGMGASSYDWGLSIKTDATGNVYTTGFFQGTVDFNPGAGVSNLTASGIDIFISKLDASGNFVWAKSIGSSGEDKGNSVVLDASANVYITGYYSGTADFDPGAGTNTLATSGAKDIFILKLDAAGNFVWAKKMGGSGFDQGNSIALDATGNVYSIGSFNNTVDFDPGAGVSNLISLGNDEIFISKLDASGNFVWAKQMGANGTDKGFSIAIDASNNVYSTGNFQSTVDFDPGVGTSTLTAASLDIFVSKLDASGNFVWAKSMIGSDLATGNTIALDATGNVYLSGVFQGTVDFDPGAAVFNLSQTGVMLNSPDIFVSKLDASGNFVWAKSMGSANHDAGNSIAIDATANVYITGHFQSTCDFDPGIGTFTLTATGQDPFITKLDASGNFVWAKSFSGTGGGEGFAISLDSQNNIYNTGGFSGTLDFDPGAGVFNLSGNITDDVYVLKLSQGNVGLENSSITSNSTSFYPNPTSGFITLAMKELNDYSTVLISNSFGEIVQNVIIENEQTSIDISSFPVGIYFMTIKQNDTIKIIKLLKE